MSSECSVCGATNGSEVCWDGVRYEDDCPLLAEIRRDYPEDVPAANRLTPTLVSHTPGLESRDASV